MPPLNRQWLVRWATVFERVGAGCGRASTVVRPGGARKELMGAVAEGRPGPAQGEAGDGAGCRQETWGDAPADPLSHSRDDPRKAYPSRHIVPLAGEHEGGLFPEEVVAVSCTQVPSLRPAASTARQNSEKSLIVHRPTLGETYQSSGRFSVTGMRPTSTGGSAPASGRSWETRRMAWRHTRSLFRDTHRCRGTFLIRTFISTDAPINSSVNAFRFYQFL